MANHPEKLFADRFRRQLAQASVYPIDDLLPVSATVRRKDRFFKGLCLLYRDTLSFKPGSMYINITVLTVPVSYPNLTLPTLYEV